MRLLAENASDLIFRYRLHPTPSFEYVSPASTTIVGYTPDEHYADPELGLKIVHPEDREILETVLVGENPSQEPLLMRWQHKDGGIVWTEQRTKVVFDDEGIAVAIEGIARDVSQRISGEQDLRRSEEALQRAQERLTRQTERLFVEIEMARLDA